MSFRPRFIVLKCKRTTIMLLQEESLAAGDTLNSLQIRKNKKGKHTTPHQPHQTLSNNQMENQNKNKHSPEVNGDIPGRARGYL